MANGDNEQEAYGDVNVRTFLMLQHNFIEGLPVKDYEKPSDQTYLLWLYAMKENRFGLLKTNAPTLAIMWGEETDYAKAVLDRLQSKGHVHVDKLYVILSDWRRAMGGEKNFKRERDDRLAVTKGMAKAALATFDRLTTDGQQAYLQSCGLTSKDDLWNIIDRQDNRGRPPGNKKPGNSDGIVEERPDNSKNIVPKSNKKKIDDLASDSDSDPEEEEETPTPSSSSSLVNSLEAQYRDAITECYGLAMMKNKEWVASGKALTGVEEAARRLVSYHRSREWAESRTQVRNGAAYLLLAIEDYETVLLSKVNGNPFHVGNLAGEAFWLHFDAFMASPRTPDDDSNSQRPRKLLQKYMDNRGRMTHKEAAAKIVALTWPDEGQEDKPPKEETPKVEEPKPDRPRRRQPADEPISYRADKVKSEGEAEYEYTQVPDKPTPLDRVRAQLDKDDPRAD